MNSGEVLKNTQDARFFWCWSISASVFHCSLTIYSIHKLSEGLLWSIPMFAHVFTTVPLFACSLWGPPRKIRLGQVAPRTSKGGRNRRASTSGVSGLTWHECAFRFTVLDLGKWDKIYGYGIYGFGYVKIVFENYHRNSGFTHWTWWFSIVMEQFTRG